MKRNYFKGLLAALPLLGLGTSQAWADKIVTSTAENPLWFRILAERGSRYLTDNGTGQKYNGVAKSDSPSDNTLWRFVNNNDGTVSIVSKAGNYIDPNKLEDLGISTNDKAFVAVSTVPSAGWVATEIQNKADYYIVASGNVQLHQSNFANTPIITYGGGNNTSDEGCRFQFIDVTRAGITNETKKAAYDEVASYTVGINPGDKSDASRKAFLDVILSETSTDAEVTAAKEKFLNDMVEVQPGKSYYIVSGPSADYCQGKYVYCNESGGWPLWGNKLVSAVYGWTFVDAGDGKYYLQNYGTKEYIEPTEEGYGKNGTRTSKEPKTKYTVKYLGQGAFNIIPEGKNPLHAQKDGTRLVTWEGGLNTASAWHLQEISKEELNSKVGFTSVSVTPGTQTYAAGNKDQVLLSFTAMLSGFVGNVGNANVKLNLNATDFNDLQNIKVYKSNNANFVSNGKRDAVVVGELATPTANEVTIPFNSDYNVPFGGSLYYVTADIKESAAVGNEVDVEVASITNEDNTLTVDNGNPEGIARIYKVQSVPFMPNDLGAPYWRIPSMVVLHNQKGANASKNGRVVTMADNRFNHGSDLPNHIDVYERHSDNNGKTWSDHKWVVGNATDEALVAGKDGSHKGFGDVTMVETASGKIIALMVGGQGYWSSTNEDGNRIVPVIITSTDGGDTWSQARALTDELYKGVYEQGQVLGSFAGSGRGICLQRQKDAKLNGRVMFAMSHRFATGGVQEYIIYSDDEGETWKMSPKSAYNGGDESKLVELADGTVMISVRQSGKRGFNTSTDGGMTWGTQTTNADINGNACNADILYYNNKVLLHSYINNGSRKNVTVKASFDNGKTWGHPVVICAPSSCYSTMDITKDGDIAIFYEDNACTQGYALNYAVFPIDWIVPGGDPSAEAFQEALAKAKAATTNEGYTDEATAKAGQYSQEAIDNVKSLIATYEASVTDYEAATAALNAAVEAMGKTACTVDGYYNETTFTISSLSTISSLEGAGYISADAKAKSEADNTAEWQIVPATVAGQVYIKLKDADTYIFRSGTTLAASAAPQAWKLVKNDGFYNLIAVHKAENSYLVINVGTGEFNWWTSAAGDNTWSTKFVLTAKTVVTGINNATVANGSEKAVRYYDLQGRRVLNPTKGLFITNTGKKVIK